MKLVGVNHDWGIGDQLAGGAYQVARDHGLDVLRYTLYWNRVNPRPGVWDFEIPRRELEAAKRAGMRIFLNIMWAPRWTSNDLPTYEPFYCRKPDPDPGGALFDSSLPGCSKPPRISEGSIWGVSFKVMEQLGDLIEWAAPWNEPNYPLFFPPRAEDLEHGFQRYFEEIAKPFCDALRFYAQTENRTVKIAGPEVEDAGALRTLLQLERDTIGKPWRSHGGGGRLWDLIAFHCYSWTHRPDGSKVYPGGMLSRLRNDFLPVIREFREDREVWLTETAANVVQDTPAQLDMQKRELIEMLPELQGELELDALLLYRLKRESHDYPDHGLVLSDDRPSPALVALGSLLTSADSPRRRPARRRP